MLTLCHQLVRFVFVLCFECVKYLLWNIVNGIFLLGIILPVIIHKTDRCLQLIIYDFVGFFRSRFGIVFAVQTHRFDDRK